MPFFSGSSSTPSSSSSSSHHWKYDVFLSFRGEDTRTNFTDHLKSALLHAGIRTFFDENDLETGEPIGPDLLKAIEESMCWIIVFSKGYAFSTWCLDELAHIMECKKTSNRKLVPIFYDVDPSDVRKQKESFEKAFAGHQVRFKHESGKLKRWRDALTEATKLKGVDARNRFHSLEDKLLLKQAFEIISADKCFRSSSTLIDAIPPSALILASHSLTIVFADSSPYLSYPRQLSA